jgi:hypothetical protein
MLKLLYHYFPLFQTTNKGNIPLLIVLKLHSYHIPIPIHIPTVRDPMNQRRPQPLHVPTSEACISQPIHPGGIEEVATEVQIDQVLIANLMTSWMLA